ncbi:MAG TPA: ATP-binding domain-containing protein, partial [Xanthobacteraceae bacterium]
DEFDFGYVLTVHKAQGSQWDDVVLFDESFAFTDSRDRWLYTGITRAAKRLTVVT